MKGFVLSILMTLLVFMGTTAQERPLSVSDFESLASLSDKHTDDFLAHKGFKQPKGYAMGAEYVYTSKNQNESDSAYRVVSDISRQNDFSFTYTTSSKEEFAQIFAELQNNNFWKSLNNDGSVLFQRKDLNIYCRQKLLGDTMLLYEFDIQRSALPSIADIRFAEDLTRFDTHEHLAGAFGEKNVVRDVYYFDDNSLQKCSVLFPNSSKQVIFIWKDEASMSGLAYILVGGSLRTNGAASFSQSLPLSDWKFEKGVRIGMNLEEVQKLNKKEFEIFGRLSEFQGAVVPSSQGEINFKKTGLQFQCMNCYAGSAAQAEKITSSAAIDNDLQMHLVSVLIMPDKNRDN